MKQHIIGLMVKTEKQGEALAQAQKEIAALKGKMTELEASTKKTTGALGGLKNGLASSLTSVVAMVGGITGLVMALVKGAKAALDKQRALRVLSDTARDYGIDGGKAADAARKLGDELEKLGFDDGEVIRGTADLVEQTKNLDQALAAASLAADLATRKNIPYQQSLNIIQDLIAGKERSVISAHEMFGTVATTTQGTIDELQAKFTGYAASIKDTKTEILAAKEELGNFFEGAGEKAAEWLNWFIKAAKTVVDWVAAVFMGWHERVKNAYANTKAAVTLNFSDIAQNNAELKKQLEIIWGGFEEQYGYIWGKGKPPTAGPEMDPTQYGPFARPTRIVSNPINKGGKEEAPFGELPKLEREYTDLTRAEARKRVMAIQAEAMARLKAQSDLHSEILGMTKAEADAYIKAAQDKIAIELLLRQQQAEKEEQTRQGIENFSAAAQAIWGKNKSVAIATTIIETLVGAQRAFSQTPGPIWVQVAAAAAALAMGYARVRQIQQTNPGGGGGGGGSSSGGGNGQGWNYYGGGGSSPVTAPSTNITSTTNNMAPAQSITIQTIVPSQAAPILNDLNRRMQPASRNFRRATLGNRSTTRGSQRDR